MSPSFEAFSSLEIDVRRLFPKCRAVEKIKFLFILFQFQNVLLQKKQNWNNEKYLKKFNLTEKYCYKEFFVILVWEAKIIIFSLKVL